MNSLLRCTYTCICLLLRIPDPNVCTFSREEELYYNETDITLTKFSLLHSISRVFKTTNFHFIQELNFCIRWSTEHFSKHRYVAIRTLEIFILAYSGWYISCSMKKNIQESIALNVYPGTKLFICFSWQDEIESWNFREKISEIGRGSPVLNVLSSSYGCC